MAKKEEINQAATDLEQMVKSMEPEKQEVSLVEKLVKSADGEDMEDDEDEEDEEKDDKEKEEMQRSHASPAAEEMKKSLASSETYQEVIDVSDAFGVLGDALVKGIGTLEQAHGASDVRLARVERHMALMMKAQAHILRALDDRTPLRKPMTGHFGGLQKSQATEKSAGVAYTEKQLKRAATVLLEEQKLPPGSGAVLNTRGAMALYKSFGPEQQSLFAEVIEKERIAA